MFSMFAQAKKAILLHELLKEQNNKSESKMVIPALTTEFRQQWKSHLKSSRKRAHLSGSGYGCQETSQATVQYGHFIEIMMWETSGRQLFSPAVCIHKQSSHEMWKPCLNFSLDVNNNDTIVRIIINHGFCAHVDEPAETVYEESSSDCPYPKTWDTKQGIWVTLKS